MLSKVRNNNPAFLNNVSLTNRLERADQADLEVIPGWETFNPDEKKFLAVYPWFGQKKSAAKYIGRTAQWLDRHQRQNPVFKSAIDSRQWAPVKMARQLGADLLGKSMMRLDELLEPGVDKRTQLEAIKHLHKLNSMGVPEAEDPRAILNQNLTIKMFDWGQGEEARIVGYKPPGHVVDGEVIEIQGDDDQSPPVESG